MMMPTTPAYNDKNKALVMMSYPKKFARCGSQLIALVLAFSSIPGHAQSSPGEWLERMAGVVGVADYEGTVIRLQNGSADAFKVAHRIVDGVVNEKLISLEGNGLEIIRVGNEVHCILPDRKTVLVEKWNNQSTLFSALPRNEVGYGPQYNLSLVREDRVAGRSTVMLAIRPHDEFRYGHRIWLDTEQSFPLKTELLNVNGEVIEQIKFADIQFGKSVAEDILAPTVNIDSFTWYTEPARYKAVPVDTDWTSDDLPPGFQVVSSKKEQRDGASETVTHIVFSDGLANVSVFVAENSDKDSAGPSRVGTSNSYSVKQGDLHITAVGKVPVATVRRIASSMSGE
jgi:sigma-E factor negative regulatory protein RseB